jgi:hypothetical protein
MACTAKSLGGGLAGGGLDCPDLPYINSRRDFSTRSLLVAREYMFYRYIMALEVSMPIC